jgi:hypothetical protein
MKLPFTLAYAFGYDEMPLWTPNFQSTRHAHAIHPFRINCEAMSCCIDLLQLGEIRVYEYVYEYESAIQPIPRLRFGLPI